MKKDLKKLVALLLLGAAALTGCAVNNGRYHHNRHDRGHYHDSTHGGNSGYHDRNNGYGYNY